VIRAGVVLAIVLHALRAWGDGRDDAVALMREANAAYADLRFAETVELVDRAWRAGTSGPVELRAMFVLAGRAAGSTGDHDVAVAWFARWLCLDRGADLPTGTSPKLTALVADAHTSLGGAVLSARATRSASSVDLVIASDPLSLAAAARLGGTRRELASTTVQFPPADGDVQLLDGHGNVLANIAVERAGVPVEPRQWYARWPAWTIASASLVAVAGVSLFVAIDARNTIRAFDADSASHQYADVVRYERRLDVAQWTARIAIGAAAVSSVVGAVLWQRERGEHITVGATPQGASIAWRSAF
jgi:hypothetical protein